MAAVASAARRRFRSISAISAVPASASLRTDSKDERGFDGQGEEEQRDSGA